MGRSDSTETSRDSSTVAESTTPAKTSIVRRRSEIVKLVDLIEAIVLP